MRSISAALCVALFACKANNPGGENASSSGGAGSTSGGSATSSGSGGSASSGGASTGSSASSGSSSGQTAASCNAPFAATLHTEGALPSGVTLMDGFSASAVANVSQARELATLPNGDLLVGTQSAKVYLVQSAEGTPSAPTVFATLADSNAAGIALSPGFVYFGGQSSVWRAAYSDGDTTAQTLTAIFAVRTGGVSGGGDDIHKTTSLAVSGNTLFVSIGSSCNACKEDDATRAAVWKMNLDGTDAKQIATRIRNAIALAVNPQSGMLWAGGAGQDDLTPGHPYEYMDAVTSHGAGVADYGWPDCEENNVAYKTGADCSHTVTPTIELTAYSTHIGATFYGAVATASAIFPSAFSGGLFVTNHGSWHGPNSSPSAPTSTPPSVSFVPMNGDAPCSSVEWANGNSQQVTFMSGMGLTNSTSYSARPTGIAVGNEGSLFIADDQNGRVYRIRPAAR